MPSPPISHPASGDPAARLRVQEVRIADLEAALWDAGPSEALLADYQVAFRELEELLAVHGGAGRRHRIVIVIPVADSPRQLAACLDSLLTQCRSYAYGGLRNGRFAKVAVLLADDSMQADSIARNREILRNLDRQGIDTHYFGAEEQRALMQRVHSLEIDGIVGVHPEQAFAHKGQAMMRNIAYLKLAEMRARMPGERLLFYTIDADQRFHGVLQRKDAFHAAVIVDDQENVGPVVQQLLQHLAERGFVFDGEDLPFEFVESCFALIAVFIL